MCIHILCMHIMFLPHSVQMGNLMVDRRSCYISLTWPATHHIASATDPPQRIRSPQLTHHIAYTTHRWKWIVTQRSKWSQIFFGTPIQPWPQPNLNPNPAQPQHNSSMALLSPCLSIIFVTHLKQVCTQNTQISCCIGSDPKVRLYLGSNNGGQLNSTADKRRCPTPIYFCHFQVFAAVYSC